jgi:hypothetical protein
MNTFQYVHRYHVERVGSTLPSDTATEVPCFKDGIQFGDFRRAGVFALIFLGVLEGCWVSNSKKNVLCLKV